MAEVSKEHENKLKGISMHDEKMIESLVDIHMMNVEASGLDPRVHALCRISALVTMDAPIASYAWQVAMALESGVTVDEIVGVLIALAPTVGMARIVAAAPKLAQVLNIEIKPEELGKRAA